MSEDVLRIFQSLRHFCVVAIQSLVERHCRSFALLVHVRHISILRIEQYLCMVLEIDLHDLVAQTEHDGMLRSHPFLNIHRAWRVLKLVGLIQFIALNQSLLFLRIIVLLKIRLKMSEQGHLLLEVLRIIIEAEL